MLESVCLCKQIIFFLGSIKVLFIALRFFFYNSPNLLLSFFVYSKPCPIIINIPIDTMRVIIFNLICIFIIFGYLWVIVSRKMLSLPTSLSINFHNLCIAVDWSDSLVNESPVHYSVPYQSNAVLKIVCFNFWLILVSVHRKVSLDTSNSNKVYLF